MKRLAIHVCFLAGISLALFALHSCTDDNPVKPPPSAPDTTNHSFVWHTDTLGDWLSSVNDVFCLSETDAWAVGWFYKRDDAGKVIDSLTSNAAHWDGVKWTLMRIEALFNGKPSFGELFTIYAFNQNNIWTSPARHWNGVEWIANDVSQVATGMTRKIWGKHPDAMYFVGENGSLMFWDGLRFYQMGYATTAANRDVWGWEDTVYVAASDYNRDSGAPGYVIKLVRGLVTDREILQDGEQISVWGMHGVWYSGGCSGLYRKTGPKWSMIQGFEKCITGIRGTGLNDVYVAMEEGKVLHYNGRTWAVALPFEKRGIFFPHGFSVKGNAVFLSGNLNYRAVVYRGYRQE